MFVESMEEVDDIIERLGIDWDAVDYTPEDVKRGAKVEMEHYDTVDGDMEVIARIAVDHLEELGSAYYQELDAMEKALEDKDDGLDESAKKAGGIVERVGTTSEPQTFYHGTDSPEFEKFEPAKAVKSERFWNPLGNAMYVSDVSNFASQFGKHVYDVAMPQGVRYKTFSYREWISAGMDLVKRALKIAGIEWNDKWNDNGVKLGVELGHKTEIYKIIQNHAPYEGLYEVHAFVHMSFPRDVAEKFTDALPGLSDQKFGRYDFVVFESSEAYGSKEIVIYNPALQKVVAKKNPLGESAGYSTDFAMNAADNAQEAFNEICANALDEVPYQFYGSIRNGKLVHRQPWDVLPFARISKIWKDFSSIHVVRDERGVWEARDLVVGNTAKLVANTLLMGHESADPKGYFADAYENYRDTLGEDPPMGEAGIPYYDLFDQYVTDDAGNWRISDYGLDKLSDLCIHMMSTNDAKEALMLLDQALNVTHYRSNLAAWFVQGGISSLSKLFNESVEAGSGVTGEYWWMDGDLVGADGDIGDMNHESYAIQSATSRIAEILELRENDGMGMQDYFPEIVETYGEQQDMGKFIVSKIAESGLVKDVDPEYLYDVAMNNTDARVYGISCLGWMRIKGDNIDVGILDSGTMREVARAMQTAFYEEQDDDAPEDLTVSIWVEKAKAMFDSVPISVLSSGDMNAMREFRRQ